MDLPPSGWYPDPYGTPSLLRWWDGSGWTQHTHPDVTAGGNGAGGTPEATAVQGAALAATALQGTAVQATTGQASVESTAVQATTLQAAALRPGGQAAAGQPSAEWLRQTKPPAGPPTQPQPALPVSPGTAPVGQATAVIPGGYQPAAVQPGYPQPGMAWGPGGGNGAGSTQVMGFGGDWQAQGAAGYGLPGSGLVGNPYGYQEARRRRRRRLIVGLGVGAVVAIAAIAVIASSLGGSPSTSAADQSPTAPPPSAGAASAPTASAAASVSPSASPSASPAMTMSGSLVADSQSGLSYSQLPAPWQASASCPLNSGVFPWTDGEDAVAGQVNGGNGPVTWYGEACSGPLPQQYGYTGPADLQNAADSLASTFENAYYGAFSPNITAGQDTPIQVSGHAAWEVTYDVSYPNAAAQGMTWNDEEAAVVVVDNGTDTPAVFFTSVPYTLNEGNIPTLVSSLQLSGSLAATSPQPGATAADGAQDGDGGDGGDGQ